MKTARSKKKQTLGLDEFVKQTPLVDQPTQSEIICDDDVPGNSAIHNEWLKITLSRIEKARQDPTLLMDWHTAMRSLKP